MGLGETEAGMHMKDILKRLGVRNRTEAGLRYFDLVHPAPREPR